MVFAQYNITILKETVDERSLEQIQPYESTVRLSENRF